MGTQFITNERGEKTAVIIPIAEYEDLLHQCHLKLELTDDYEKMIDVMLDDETKGNAQYVPYQEVREKFIRS